ncbi:MAG: MSCRAMM family adhesin SdrC [Clostridiales bacterium]|nr:MSCRAMM family adhesin SdrC [Clostridiales bacterium]
MRKIIRSRKSFLIKGIAIAIILCVLAANLSISVFAEENDSSLHNVSENENVNDDNSDVSSESISAESTNSEKDITGETDSAGTTGSKTDNETEEPKKEEDEEKESNNIENDETDEKNDEVNTVSGNDISGDTADNDIDAENAEVTKIDEGQDIPEIINVVVPTSYTLALNPYGLSIKIGNNTISTEQVISGTYGIVNKSSTDQIVKVSLTVEDRNGGELVFVDSAQEAAEAEENVYAIYLEVVPANEEQILIDGEPADSEITGEALRKVDMTGAKEQAVPLHDGLNSIAFKLSGAVYNDDNELVELSPDGKGVSAYTFSGVMNSNAEWEKLSGGIKLSVVYTYKTAAGDEEIIEGTGAMIRVD